MLGRNTSGLSLQTDRRVSPENFSARGKPFQSIGDGVSEILRLVRVHDLGLEGEARLRHPSFDHSYKLEDHLERVKNLAVKVAQFMSYSEEEVSTIGLAALTHDVGKIRRCNHSYRSIESFKPDSEEFLHRQSHALTSAEFWDKIIQDLREPERTRAERIRVMVRYHHRPGDIPDSHQSLREPTTIILMSDRFVARQEDRGSRKGKDQFETIAFMRKHLNDSDLAGVYTEASQILDVINYQ